MAPSVKAFVVAALVACSVATTSAAQEASPFPRGWVVFSGDTENGTLCCWLFRISTDGSGLHRLTRPGAYYDPSFAPNGKRFAFVRLERSGGSSILSTDLDGNKGRLLATGDVHLPVYSPNGKQIAFVRNGRLWVMRADGRGQRRLRRAPIGPGRPSWTPDGKSIVLAAGEGAYEPVYLYTLDARTGQVEKRFFLHDNDGDGLPGPTAVLSPDGRTVLFVSGRGLYRRPLAGGPSRHVCNDCAADSWSADSRVIAYAHGTEIRLLVLHTGRTKSIPLRGAHVYGIESSVALQPR